MKVKLIKLITVICCFSLLVSTNVQGQEVDNSFNKTPQEMHDMFMQKHSENKTIGWITFGSGIAMIAGGIAINVSANIDAIYGAPQNNEGLWLSYLGGGVTLISIPLLISAGSNKRKAKLALTRESTVVGFKNNTQHISLSFTIPF